MGDNDMRARSTRRGLIHRAAIALATMGLSGCELDGLKNQVEAADGPVFRAFNDEWNLDTIASIPDDELEYRVFVHLSDRLPYDNDPFLTAFPHLSPGARAIFATWVLEGEVDNGGFSQFFFNSSAPLAYEARDGCLFIGAPEHARIVNDAITLEKRKGTPNSQFPESGAPPILSDFYGYADYDTLDNQFYASTEDLSLLRIRCIRARPSDFLDP